NHCAASLACGILDRSAFVLDGDSTALLRYQFVPRVISRRAAGERARHRVGSLLSYLVAQLEQLLNRFSGYVEFLKSGQRSRHVVYERDATFSIDGDHGVADVRQDGRKTLLVFG